MEQQTNSFEQTFERTFSGLIGEWQGMTRTWFEPGTPVVEAATEGVMRALPGGRFLIFEYHSSMEQQPFQGLYLIGFNQLSGQVEAAWADSFHMSTNMMVLTGDALPDGFSVLGQWRTDVTMPFWGWRTEFHLLGTDRWLMTAYIITPEGEEAKAVETEFQRVGL